MRQFQNKAIVVGVVSTYPRSIVA